MKKNRMLKLASALLVLCLITTCAISTTFAKYVTSDDASDSAQVAKWGVTVTVNNVDDIVDTKDSATEGHILTATTYSMVAPGTTGTLATVVIDGTPEVAFSVSAEATLTLTGWTVDSTDYCPIEIKVGNGDWIKNVNNVTALQTAVKTAVESELNKAEVAADEDADASLTISWRWAFEGNDDESDTALGNAAAEGNPATIKFDLKVTVTQVD